MSEQTPVELDDLEEALLFLDAGGDAQAWLCRDTGVVLWHSDGFDEFGPLPADIDDAARYVALPKKHDLDLGKPLVLEFARTQLLRAGARDVLAPQRLRPLQGSAGASPQPRRLAPVGDGADPPGTARWCANNGVKLVD